jgi:hypothetical protein
MPVTKPGQVLPQWVWTNLLMIIGPSNFELGSPVGADFRDALHNRFNPCGCYFGMLDPSSNPRLCPDFGV